MPFTIGGDYIPDKPPENKKPTKVFLEHRKKSPVTIINNLNLSKEEGKKLASKIQKKLGCGGSYKNDRIEIQGNKVEEVKKILKNL
jgi:translation initiation factor 1